MKKNIIAGIFLTALFIATPLYAIEYRFTPLGDVDGFMAAYDINEAGQIVGAKGFLEDQAVHGYLLDDGVIQKIGLSGESVSKAFKVNNSGQVLGSALQYDISLDTTVSVNFKFSDGQATVLPDANSQTTGLSVVAINDHNQMVFDQGSSYGRLTSRSFLYENNTFQQLGFLGGSHTNVSDINNAGQIVGGANIAQTDLNGDQLTRAYIHQDGVMAEIPMIDDAGSLPAFNESYANAINNHGHVTGNLYTYNDSLIQTNSAFLYRNGQMEDIGGLGYLIGPQDINDLDQIVGTYIDSDESGARMMSAFTYQDALGLVDLNSLLDAVTVNDGWVLNEANAVNNKGQIVGVASNTNYADSVFAYVLTPVPEPESYALLLAGLGLMSVSIRLKQK